MCLLYIFINPNPKPNGYHLILANNRDEFYYRRTNIAKFWNDERSVIGGIDMEEGKEGGTWLAMNKNGKIAALLNVLLPKDQLLENGGGRGFLVPDYVRSSDDPVAFLEKLSETGTSYNGFLLVAIDISHDPKKTKGAYYSNSYGIPPQLLSPGVSVFGNTSSLARPWLKATYSQALFQEIVGTDPLVFERDDLVNNLFQLLKDPKSYGVDEQVSLQGRDWPKDVVTALGSVFVTAPAHNYGTRSHTIILVDALGRVEYIESSMKEPISLQDGVCWVDVKEKFIMNY